MNLSVLKNDEKAIFTLRSLYQKYGYLQYKMSKFEEYDLYVRNKDFLVSDNIITFTDTNGKLMALKPDVTLSIIKNGNDKEGSIEKLYYNENVYRVSKGTHTYKEIMQTGLECIGDIDNYCIYEVLFLAAESLKSISNDFVLDISHVGIISEVIKSLNISNEAESKIIRCIGEKNQHEIKKICEENSVSDEKINILLMLVSLYGTPDDVISKLEVIIPDSQALMQLKDIMALLKTSDFYNNLKIDFSVINDMNYYNAIVFKGFVKGLPSGILSGGQYDNLMKKMGRKSGAIGFAVYLDMLELLPSDEKGYDVDTIILYDEKSDISKLNDAIKLLTGSGQSVLAQKKKPEKIKYKQLLKLTERGVEILENNA